MLNGRTGCWVCPMGLQPTGSHQLSAIQNHRFVSFIELLGSVFVEMFTSGRSFVTSAGVLSCCVGSSVQLLSGPESLELFDD